MLIVIEGIDKSGKTTQVGMLKDALSKEFRVATLSFPDYSTIIGNEIKKFLTKGGYNTRVMHLLLSANRWENKDRLESLLSSNDILILNRYYQSNIVYGLANDLPLDWLEMLDKGLPKEDLTIIIDISIDTFLARISKPDIFESDLTKMRNVIRVYRELVGRYGWNIINGEKSKDEVHKDIMKIVRSFINKHHL
ncbi:MAG: dTMP kinase [Candidatus Nitrosocaldaceae archaeon]